MAIGVSSGFNWQLIASGSAPVNHKRVYRIMWQNNLLLAGFTGSRSDKAHAGKVSTLQRNQRWCSDGFEIACDNGERVRVIFALDICAREVMAYYATTGGYSADMAHGVMLACVEKQFGDVKTLQPVEWLSDRLLLHGKRNNNFCRRAWVSSASVLHLAAPKATVRLNFRQSIQTGLLFCNDRSDAKTVMAQHPGWFEDYNENAPHQALRMLSPREFIRTLQNLECPV